MVTKGKAADPKADLLRILDDWSELWRWEYVFKRVDERDGCRGFGERWASRLMPQVLKELMRHESIETTLNFYVGRNAQTTAKAIWGQYGPAGVVAKFNQAPARMPV